MLSDIVKLSVLICISLGMYACSNSYEKSDENFERPNIILFIGDDISQADFGVYGHPTIKTPNIDKLASQGILFENAYLTTSSCSPTRTSLITGRYPHNTGGPELHMTENPHLEDLPMFPNELKKSGYYTAQAGKWHFNGDPSKAFEKRYNGGKSGAENWVKALKERPKQDPFFFWFAAFDAHRGWDMKLEDGPNSQDDFIVPKHLIDNVETRKDLAQYYNEVNRFDRNIGTVIDELKAQGVYENTLLIVMADNGRPFPRDKTWLFDGGIKTPLIIHWSKIIKGNYRNTELVSTIDLAPTLLDLLNIEIPKTFQGVSLKNLFIEQNTKFRDFVFAERNWHAQRYHERMVRFENLVYIRNSIPNYVGFNTVHYGKLNQPAYVELVNMWKENGTNEIQNFVFQKPSPPEQLYDLGTDPNQYQNLIDDSMYNEKLKFLRTAMDQWIESTGDTSPEFDKMTPDRNSRETWLPIIPSGRPEGGIIPGEETKAWNINNSGPVFLKDISDF